MDVKSVFLCVINSRILDLLLDLGVVSVEGDIERLSAAEVVIAFLTDRR